MKSPGAFEYSGQSIRDVIDQHAERTPDHIFLIDPTNGQSLTYADLQAAARAVANRLANEGAKPGDTVAYALKNGAGAARAILGLFYGGYLATAVNLVSGSRTIAHVLEHSRAGIVLVQEDTRALVEETAAGGNLRLLSVDEALFESRPDTLPDAPVSSTDDGLLMYTSGTTGVPKGVLLTHGNLLAGGCNTANAHMLGGSDRGLCVLPLYHINGLCVTLLGALVSGSCVIMPSRFSVSLFWQHLRDHEGTWFSVVPTQISYLLAEAEANGHDTAGLEQLRFGRSASSALSPDVQRSFEDKFAIPVIETMGLTETAAQILSNPMTGTRKIGSPGIASGNEIIVGDEHQNELPRGQEGEVLVRGPNVMRGYLRNEEATSNALTPDGWLRTGDLGRMDDDGFVFITGRLKELIIKGGENIAPREIDEALYALPDVIEAAAFACDCTTYGQRVEAAVMLSPGSSWTSEKLVAECRTSLGKFKAPDHVHILPELPKGPSGKIQRLKLVEITQSDLAG